MCIKLIFPQWSVRWHLSHELSKLWEKVGQYLLWSGREEIRSQRQHHFFPKIFENFIPHDLETEGNGPSLRLPEWRVVQLWVLLRLWGIWGCGKCTYSKCNCVILRVIFFFYCLRHLILTSVKSKILSLENIQAKSWAHLPMKVK